LEYRTRVKLTVSLATASRLGFVLVAREEDQASGPFLYGDPEKAPLALIQPLGHSD
jgi:hypothetical protein